MKKIIKFKDDIIKKLNNQLSEYEIEFQSK